MINFFSIVLIEAINFLIVR